MKRAFHAVFLVIVLTICGCRNEKSLTTAEEERHKAEDFIITAKKGSMGNYFDSGSFKGGAITDGADIREIKWIQKGNIERIEIAVYKSLLSDNETMPFEKPSYFLLEKRKYPHSFELFFGGTRTFSAYSGMPALNERLKNSRLIEGIYPIIMLDDSAGKIGITLKQAVYFKIYELHNPARVIIDMKGRETKAVLPDIFSIRTLSGIAGESGDILRERLTGLTGVESRYLIDNRGQYLIEAGYYRTHKEAESIIATIREADPAIELFIEKRAENDVPENRSILE